MLPSSSIQDTTNPNFRKKSTHYAISEHQGVSSPESAITYSLCIQTPIHTFNVSWKYEHPYAYCKPRTPCESQTCFCIVVEINSCVLTESNIQQATYIVLIKMVPSVIIKTLHLC